MGIFGGSSTADPEVESATSPKNESEKWDLILDICDKAGKSSDDAKNYLKATLKRLHNPDPHVAIQAATLLDACVSNSGKTFHIEVASREFENEFMKVIHKCHQKVGQKLCESLKKWAENEFKTDPQLNLVPSLYSKLKDLEMYHNLSQAPAPKEIPLSTDPNVVQSQEEEDQIVKAIELSLKESTGSPRAASLYPSTNIMNATSAAPAKEPRKVRALYDFEAAEDNELTFNSGEIIFVLDDSDANWWKGQNQRGEGLFPANFVTSDLTIEPEQYLYEKAKKAVQFQEEQAKVKNEKEPEEVEINEEKIDRLLHLLHEADPTNPEQDTEEMLSLEREVNLMGPLIDTELERVDRKHAQLTQLSSDLVEAVSLYHSLMREPQFPSVNKMYGFPQPVPPSPSNVYNGSLQSTMSLPHQHVHRSYIGQLGPVPSATQYQGPMSIPQQFPMPGQHMPMQAQMMPMMPPQVQMQQSLAQALPPQPPQQQQPQQQQQQPDDRRHDGPQQYPTGMVTLNQGIPSGIPMGGAMVLPHSSSGGHFQPA